MTQFQPRPQLLTREQLTHCPTVYSYADAVLSPLLPPPTPESLRSDRMPYLIFAYPEERHHLAVRHITHSLYYKA